MDGAAIVRLFAYCRAAGYQAVISMLAAFGLPAGEVAGLRLEDVNWRAEREMEG